MSDRISCGIARDLMPLVIDDACGEESRQAFYAVHEENPAENPLDKNPVRSTGHDPAGDDRVLRSQSRKPFFGVYNSACFLDP